MKKSISLVLCLVMLIGCFSLNSFALDGGATSRLTNAAGTTSNFYISDDGLAVMTASYVAYPDLLVKTRVTMTLEKRTMLFFWDEVTHWIDVSYDDEHVFEHTRTVSKGTYRLTVYFEIIGNTVTDEFETTHQYSY